MLLINLYGLKKKGILNMLSSLEWVTLCTYEKEEDSFLTECDT
jgi:hypothetical protein